MRRMRGDCGRNGEDRIGNFLWPNVRRASNDNQRRAHQLIVDFLAEAAGGPAYYTGRDMKTSHDGMHISAHDWEVFMQHTRAMLAHLEVPEHETQEVLDFVTGLKAEIVEG
jgi:hemoglobin